MYENKNQDYFSNIRTDLISLIPENFRMCNVMEIGCGNGATLKTLKQMGIAKTTTGVELFPSEQNHYDTLDYFYSDDVEKLIFPEHLSGSFDIIILADVLEHLIDPWLVLKKISALLSENGKILVSLPNVRHYSVIKSIAWDGTFKYTDTGILDRTHLRFFCKKNIIELFESAGLKLDYITSTFDQETYKSKKYWVNKLTFNLFHDFFVYQFLAVGKK